MTPPALASQSFVSCVRQTRREKESVALNNTHRFADGKEVIMREEDGQGID